MKHLMLFLLLASSLSVAATEFNPALKELNAAVDELLAPVRDAHTEATVEFTDIQTNAERALAVSIKARYKKTGPANFVELRVDKLEYAYGDGTAPVTRINAHLGTDITKLLSQEHINRVIPEIESMIGAIAADATRGFGEAATVQTEILHRTQDSAGNYTGLSGRIVFQVDLSKLPDSKKSEDVMVTAFEANISADVTTGLTIGATLISNPTYRGFHKNNEGLKDALDRFLARDPIVLGELQKFIFDLNELAGRVANGQL